MRAFRTKDMYVPQVEEMVQGCQEMAQVWTWEMPNLPEEKAQPPAQSPTDRTGLPIFSFESAGH